MERIFSFTTARTLTAGVLLAAFMVTLMMAGCGQPPGPPVPPTANAGSDQTVNGGSLVQLDGRASTSTTGAALNYVWNQTGGPAVNLANATTATPTFIAPNDDTVLTFQLVVTDVNGTSAPDTVVITVNRFAGAKPTADAGEDQTVQGATLVVLDGSGSVSSSEDNLTYAWTQTGGPSVTLAQADAAQPFFVAPNDNVTLTFQLIVSDVNGTSDPSTVTITVTKIEGPVPTVSAGDNQTVIGGSVVILNGSATDITGRPLIFNWTQISGPTVIIQNNNTPTAQFQAPNINVNLVFQLVVTNVLNQSASSNVTVIVNPTGTNLPPIAFAGSNQNVNAGDNVTLDGSASTDPEGGPLTYAWTQTAGTAVTLADANAAKATFTAPQVNETLTFQLTVTDNVSQSSSASVDVVVVAANVPKPPVANAGPDQNVTGGDNVSLNGTLSFDPEGGILTYAWTQVSGTAAALVNATTATPSFLAPNVTGALVFRLTVTDPQGLSSSDNVTVNVTASSTNQPPVAKTGPNQTVNPNDNVTLDGSGSFDPEGGSLAYAWTQTGGTTVTLSNANTAKATFTAPAGTETLTFVLTVTDNATLSDNATTTVSVNNANPVANAGTNQNVKGGDNVTLNGSGSSDPDGDNLTFAWTQTGGTAVTLDNATAAITHFVAPNKTDNLTFTLTVDDGKGGTDNATTTVSVTAVPAVLFVFDYAKKVLTFTNPSTLNGNLPPTTNLFGGQTGLSTPRQGVVNTAGALMVVNGGIPASVTIYDNATTVNGNAAPNRNILGPATGIINPYGITYDRTRDLIYVNNISNILAFANAATVNGNVAPVRTITSAPGVLNTWGSYLDKLDNLYIANNNKVLVYSNVSTLNGQVAPTRIITSPAFANTIRDVFVDKDDNLLVLDRTVNNNKVHVFKNASTRNGNIMPDVTLVVAGAKYLAGITADLNGNGYLSDYDANAILVYNQIVSRNGTIVPDRIISGPNTQLADPVGLFVLEK